jgi:hypothetical protein
MDNFKKLKHYENAMCSKQKSRQLSINHIHLNRTTRLRSDWAFEKAAQNTLHTWVEIIILLMPLLS